MTQETWWGRELSVPVRQAQHVAYSIEMLGALPRRAAHPESTVANACGEAFLVHARLLVDFLELRGAPSRRDFAVSDFGVQTSWSDTEERVVRLRDVWLMASQHVVHLSRERTPDNPYTFSGDEEPFPYRAIAEDLLGLLDTVVERMGDDAPAMMLRGAVTMARYHLQTA